MIDSSIRPLVSVIVIFLDAARFIDEALESILAQTYDHWELLLVDDGSTDASTEIARRFVDRFPEKVRYLEHDGHKNRGMSASRNLGISHVRGKYVAFLDADDVWLPEKLERQVGILESQPGTGMLYGPTQYWHSWTGLPQDRERDNVPELGLPLDTLVEPPRLLTLLHPLGNKTAPCMCSLLVRTEVLKKIGGFEESFRGYYEDQAFLTKVYLNETIFVSSGCWDRYRIHAESCSATVEKAGRRDLFRKSFLEWFRRYLKSQAVTDPAIWKALEDAPGTVNDHLDAPVSKWFLRVAEGNVARLIRSPENPNLLRIDISRTISDQSYDTQLNLPGLKVNGGAKFVLNFMARSDAPRTISFGFAKGHAPWSNLGLHDQINLTPEWQSFERTFTILEDEHDARIYFDVGAGDASVDLTSVTLFDSSEGKLVEQARPAGESGRSAATGGILNEPPVPIHGVEFGSFRRLTPISQDFGCDRGRPIDRYYIENFLAQNESDVCGRVLEVGENFYTRQYGGDRVTVSDVLHVVEGEPQATIIADLASADHIPSNAFDCIILTQTLQLIYDVRAAVNTIRRILKPGGVLLATFPGISQTYDHEWSRTWYWNFTAVSARRLFEEAFSAEGVQVEAFGNVLAAISFLHGLAVDELTPDELDHREPGYDVTITVRAVKQPDSKLAADEAHATEKPQSVHQTKACLMARQTLILMYHRVAEGFSDPFSLAVAPARFAEQLEVLRKFATPMRLQKFVDTLDNGGLSGPTAIVTFDDGYADNLLNAKPLLARHDVPATVFLTTGYLDGQREFWWDELDRLLLQPGTLPRELKLAINGTVHDWNLGEAAHYPVEEWRVHRSWTVVEDTPTPRQSIFLDVWRLLQFLPDSKRQEVLGELQTWAGVTGAGRSTHRQLSAREVVELADGELIEVGAHTVTHPVLASLSAARQRDEIRQSKERTEEILGRRVLSFAYPFGSRPDYTPETAAVVREVGFTCACSTVPRPVERRPDRFGLPRFQVENWDGDEFARRLVEWYGN